MSVRDVILVGVAMFALGLITFLAFFFGNTMADKFQEQPLISEDELANKSFNVYKERVISKYDYMMLIIFVGLFIGIIITSWFISGNAMYSFVFFLIMAVFLGISPILSNVWVELTNKAALVATISSFPITNNLLTHLPQYVLATGLLALFILFTKPYFIGGGAGR